ncbi:DNA glycosylase, partial [Delphinella strobiligena]
MKEHKKRKSTGTTSRHFSATPDKKKVKRVAGVSSVPFPKLSAPHFGLIQEKLWQNPFQMLCAVLFLNKTNGHVAKDTILQVIEKWPTPEALAKADRDVLLGMVEGLGLQNERTRKLIQLAEAFVTDPPQKARRHRTLHYPTVGDGKTTRDEKKTSPNQILNEDFDEIEGFLEIGHLYGAGPYAYDSWRIFCRDVLRGVADGYNGEGVEGYNVSDPKSQCTFEPEWKRVVPLDKELRACLRWMWLREGWDWDPLTGKKIPASVSKIRDASQG